MKRLILTVATTFSVATVSLGQCTTLFSYAAYFNKVNFINQSTVSNAHYFWNFGDGTGSNYTNPVHTFPGNGDYLVTLFAEDTLSKCSSYYEYWVNVTEHSNNPCQPSISDSISDENLYIYNTSANCNGYSNMEYSNGTSCFISPNFMPIGLGNWQMPFRMICVGEYFDNNSNFEGVAYKTAYSGNYSSSHNYGDCSANFEFIVVSSDSNSERILFTAMNKTAKSYEWTVTGFGNPIHSHNDTISILYTIDFYCPAMVGLTIVGSSGCHDTIWQDIHIGDSAKTVLGVNDLNASKGTINVFPNPTLQSVTVQLNSNQNQNIEFILYNLMGEKVYDKKVSEQAGIIDQEIDMSSLSNGLYLLRVNEGNKYMTQKIIKQN